MVLAARVDSTASPIAPPSCCEVLSRPDAKSGVVLLDVGRRDQRDRHEGQPHADGHDHQPRQQVAEVGAGDRNPAQQQQSDTGEGHPDDAHGPNAHPSNQLLRQSSADDDAAGHREECEPGAQRAVAEHLLDVDGGEVEEREHAARDQQRLQKVGIALRSDSQALR